MTPGINEFGKALNKKLVIKGLGNNKAMKINFKPKIEVNSSVIINRSSLLSNNSQ